MKKDSGKFLVFLSLLLAVFLITLTSVLAADVYVANNVTFAVPTASSTISGTAFIFNVTNSTDFDAIINCTIFAQSTLTANSSWVRLGAALDNESYLGIDGVNGTIDLITIEDANNYELNATCRNSTSDLTDTTISSIIIDNAIPQIPTLSPATNTLVTSTGTQTFTGTVVDENTTSCTYTISRGGALSGSDYITGSGTYSGTSCTFTKTFGTATTRTADNGNWYWTITASDETNTTDSVTNILQMQITPVSGNLQQALENLGEDQITGQPFIERIKDKGNAVLIAIGIIVAVVVIIVVVRRVRR